MSKRKGVFVLCEIVFLSAIVLLESFSPLHKKPYGTLGLLVYLEDKQSVLPYPLNILHFLDVKISYPIFQCQTMLFVHPKRDSCVLPKCHLPHASIIQRAPRFHGTMFHLRRRGGGASPLAILAILPLPCQMSITNVKFLIR